MSVTTKQKQQRLLRLADYLETVPPENFDMALWGWRRTREQKCATTACALGWATNVWPRHLQMVPPGHHASLQSGVLHVASGMHGFGAAEEFFGLTEDEAVFLFEPAGHRLIDTRETPKQVAKRLREFARERGP